MKRKPSATPPATPQLSEHRRSLEASFTKRTERLRPFELVGLDRQSGAVLATPPDAAPSTPPPTGPAPASVPRPESPEANPRAELAPGEHFYQIPLDYLVPSPDQPRFMESPTEDHELMESIRLDGVLNPIHVREVGTKRYEVIAGQRRWNACARLGLKTIPAIVRKTSQDKAAVQAIVDNINRQALSPYEEAKAFSTLIQRYGLEQQEIAEQMGCHKSRISVAISILSLPPAVLDMIFASNSHMTMSHAEALLPLATNHIRLLRIVKTAIAESWSRNRIREEITRQPRENAGAQASRLTIGTNGRMSLVIRFHPNRRADIPGIRKDLEQALAHLTQLESPTDTN